MSASPTTHDAVARIRALRGLTVTALQALHAAVLGRATKSRNGTHLRRRIATAIASGAQGTTARERREIARAVRDATTARPTAPRTPRPRDPRLPPVGTVLRKVHRGEDVEIKVMRDGFRCRGRMFASLSAVAREVTGARWNGLLWLGLAARRRGRRTP